MLCLPTNNRDLGIRLLPFLLYLSRSHSSSLGFAIYTITQKIVACSPNIPLFEKHFTAAGLAGGFFYLEKSRYFDLYFYIIDVKIFIGNKLDSFYIFTLYQWNF